MHRRVRPIEVKVEGGSFPCFYAVQADMLTVWHAYLGSRTRVFMGRLDRAIVEAMAIELYRANRQHLGSPSASKP